MNLRDPKTEIDAEVNEQNTMSQNVTLIPYPPHQEWRDMHNAEVIGGVFNRKLHKQNYCTADARFTYFYGSL